MFGWMQNSYAQSTDDSLGMFIPVVVLALLWWKRQELVAAKKRVWWPPLALFALGVLLHVIGYTVQQTRLSVVGFFFGLYAIIGVFWGWRMWRATFFPFFLFAFMVPLTGEMEGLTLPLRQLATKITVLISHFLGINVLQKGTLIEDSAGHFGYNVEAACSGLRSLTTMLALGCIFGFTTFRSQWKRAVLIASAIPLAVFGNVVRLLGIVVSANWKYDQMIQARQPVNIAEQAAQALGSYVHEHSLLKLIPYIPAFVGMMLLARWLREDDDVENKEEKVETISYGPAFALAMVVLALTTSAGAFLATQHSRQKLGQPGVRIVAESIYSSEEGASTNQPVLLSSNRVYLPPHVANYQSQSGTVPITTVNTLPKDTVFGHRTYAQSNGLVIDCQVVLMGADRSSIHKPQYCLKGSGFQTMETERTVIPVSGVRSFDLPVMKLKLRREGRDVTGANRIDAGVFVYWFVADGELTAEHSQRMWWMARDMLKTGVLQRWAYVICFAPCAPGAEDATFDEMKRFIGAAVPEFHLAAGPPLAQAASASEALR
jgi:exosortase